MTEPIDHSTFARTRRKDPSSSKDRQPIEDLLLRSSLGRPGAQRLRDRTPPENARLARQIGDLEELLAPFLAGNRDLQGDQLPEMWHLAMLYREVHLFDESARAFALIARAALLAQSQAHLDAGDRKAADVAFRRGNTL